MKKTLIALLALGGLAMGEVILPTYDLKVITGANTTADSATANGDFWFEEDSLTLESYMLDFTINAKPGGPNKYYFQINSAVSASTNQIKYGAWGGSAPYGSGIYVNNSHVHAVTDPQDNAVSFSLNDTIRFAYDGTENIAYIYNVTKNTFNTLDIGYNSSWGSQYSFVSGKLSTTSTDGAARAIASSNQYATYGNITDMSSLAGNSVAFETYVKTLQVIPEPTTATLSLLALAGLAARRRRK